MSNFFGPLSDDDVRQIALLIETLDRSSLDFLQLELGDMKLTIGKGEMPATAAPIAPPATAPSSAPAASAPVSDAVPPPVPAAEAASPAEDDAAVAIVAPIMGRFYARPDPGSDPFVSVGSEVSEDTTVALIEVMKVFNAVPAGVRGAIAAICVQDTELVEYGQVMFRVRPAE